MPAFTHARLVRLLAAVSLCIAGMAAQASSILISPIIVTLGQENRSAAITVRNDGDEPRLIQTELLRWTQENGENRYAPSGDILVNPPLATLQPHQAQIFRIGLTGDPDPPQELAYRLYFSEVPMPARAGATGVRIALRIGLGVFVVPRDDPGARPEWTAFQNDDGTLRLSLHNGGNRHLKLNRLRVNDPATGAPLGELPQQSVTLLAGQTRQFTIPSPPAWRGTQLHLLSDSAGETIRASVPLIPLIMHAARP